MDETLAAFETQLGEKVRTTLNSLVELEIIDTFTAQQLSYPQSLEDIELLAKQLSNAIYALEEIQ